MLIPLQHCCGVWDALVPGRTNATCIKELKKVVYMFNVCIWL